MCNHYTRKDAKNSTGEILVDKTQTGKERDWKGKKRKSLLMADHFGQADLASKAERMRDCADTLVFRKSEERLKLYQAWFCKVRLCPMCNWRRSLKIAYHNKRIVETVNERHNVRWLFLTLTVKNTDAESLSETISDMFKGFHKLRQYKAFKTSVKGFFRALEVTRNSDPDSDAYGTYNPHFHVLLCVPAGYFKKKELYLKQDDWTKLWQRAMKLDYTPVVNVKAVKGKKNIDKENIENYEQSVKDAVLEVSKYPVKDTDIVKGNKVTKENTETVLALDNALAYKRLIGYGGILKEIHKELNLGDAEEGDLINIAEDDEQANETFEVMFKWHVGLRNYVAKE